MTDSNDQVQQASRAVLVAESFVSLADTLVDDFDVVELLDRLVRSCVNLLDVRAAAILLVNHDQTLEVVASSDEASRLMEVIQLESQAGPCIDAVRTGEAVSVSDPAELRRLWPAFGHAVGEQGFTAVHALPLRVRQEKIGALNLFGAGDQPLSDSDLRLAQALADVATIAILQQRSLSRTSLLAEQLQQALNTRILVEQAKGVLAEFSGADMGAAFEALREYSRSNRLKLGVVARQVVRRELEPGHVIDARPAMP
jgi:GAF domain-containing protein